MRTWRAALRRIGGMFGGVGLVTGLAAATALSRFMTAIVFGITAQDPVTFAAVPLVLAAVALVATIVPSRRAVRVEPMHALRED
jgi:putative ABC transport system permease protein